MIPSIPSIPAHSTMGISGGGTVWIPVFADGEQVFANGLPVMVPSRYANA